MSVRHSVPRSDADEPTEAMDLTEVNEATQPRSSALPRPTLGATRREEDHEATVIAPAHQEDREEATAIVPTGATLHSEDDDPATLRERRRAERDKALGTRRPVVEPEPEPVREDKPRFKRTTDMFLGSLGLFLLRVVTAAIIGVHGFAKALDITAVQAMLANTVIPEPVIMSYVLTGAEVAIALALLFGLFTRLAGVGLAAIGIGALVFVHWITNPFVGNALSGELELMLGAVGLLFVCLGAGGWSVDAAFRRRRAAEAA